MNFAALLILGRIIMVVGERKRACYSSEPPRTAESVAFGSDIFWRRPSIFDYFGSSVHQQAHEEVHGNAVHRSHLQTESIVNPVQETNEDVVDTCDETHPKELCTDVTCQDNEETQPKGLYTGSANPDEETTPKEIDTAAMPERLGPEGDSNP